MSPLSSEMADHWSKCLASAEEALAAWPSAADEVRRGMTLREVAVCNLYLSETRQRALPQALDAMSEALEIFRRAGNGELCADAHLKLGSIHAALADGPESPHLENSWHHLRSARRHYRARKYRVQRGIVDQEIVALSDKAPERFWLRRWLVFWPW